MVKGHGKNEDSSMTSKNGPGKFVASKVRSAHINLSNQSNHILLGPGQAAGAGGGSMQGGSTNSATVGEAGNGGSAPLLTEKDLQVNLIVTSQVINSQLEKQQVKALHTVRRIWALPGPSKRSASADPATTHAIQLRITTSATI